MIINNRRDRNRTRDITVETVSPSIKRDPGDNGIHSNQVWNNTNPNALLSRSVAGIIGNSLIYTLPGSVRAVEEYMDEIVKTLKHTFYMQYGVEKHGNG